MKTVMKIIDESFEKTINILYWVMDGTNIGPYWPPSPIPIPSVRKSHLPGGKTIENKCVFDDFL